MAFGDAAASDSLRHVDDIGMPARSIKQVGLSLKSLLDDVSHQVGGIRTACSEIAQGNADLSARTEQSAASLLETSAKDIRHLIEDSVDRTMRDIAQLVTQVGELIEEIGAVTWEQAQGISQVDVAVSQLDWP